VPLPDVVTQTGNAAGLVAGLLTSDFRLIGRSLQDVIAEPVRGKCIPGFAEMKSAALAAGALGCSISGSGPALFALSPSRDIGQSIARAMGRVLDELGCPYDTFVSTINSTGARVLGQDAP
jgi:homoserine kinase